MIDDAIYTITNNVAELQGHISPAKVQVGDFSPLCVYQLVSQQDAAAHDNVSNIRMARVQFTVYADTYTDARAIGTKVADQWRGYVGTVDGTIIHSSLVLDERSAPDDGIPAPFGYIVDVRIIYA